MANELDALKKAEELKDELEKQPKWKLYAWGAVAILGIIAVFGIIGKIWEYALMLSVVGVAGLIGWGYLEPKLKARKEQKLLEESTQKQKEEQKRAIEAEKARQQQVADELAKMKANL